MTSTADSIPPDRERTDPAPGPDADPAFAAIFERLGGIEKAIHASHVLLDSKTDAIIDGQNQRFGELSAAVASVKDEQAKHGRMLNWLKKAVSDMSEGLETLSLDLSRFMDHVMDQFQRTTFRPNEDRAANGNGHDGE